MDAFGKEMKDLTWILSSSDKTPDGRNLMVAGVNIGVKLAIRALYENDIQDAMNMFIKAVLEGPRYVGQIEIYKLVRTILRELVGNGAVFPTEKMFEFSSGTLEDCIQDMPSRVALLFASGDNLDWTQGIEAVYWEDVTNESPTKELLMRCLKWHVDKYSHILLW